MNILIPHTWLLEHLETEATPMEIQKYLSLSGPSIERIYQTEGESVYDIEVTTNRVDSMNMRGIAREAAVILNQAGIKTTLKPLRINDQDSLQLTKALPLPKIFNNSEFNKRTIFIVLKNIKRAATPSWMAKRLVQTEMNIHDAAIDITNYVTHDVGHPIHAFDYDKLMNTGGEIHIVEAKKGEKFATLDGEEFETVGGEIVFKNSEGQIIDLPSIKGTANTSIDESTQNVLLLAESIRADKVRFASMTHAIRTTAAQLMEKNIDPHLAKTTILKAVELYQDLCGAEVGSDLYDDFSGESQPIEISISIQKINDYLGLEIDQQEIIKILTDLECEVETQGKGGTAELVVTPPTFRPDLTISVDVVEEVARIYGYHNLPSKLMDTPIPTTYPKNIDFNLENKIKHFLANIGWQEIYSYSLVSEKVALESNYKIMQHLKLQNPLTDDRVYLRRSLLPSLEEIIDTNSQQKKLSVFEIANIYPPQNSDHLPDEKMVLSLVSTKEYRLVRGMLESLLNQLFITNHEIIDHKKTTKPFSQSAEILVEKNIIGTIGVLESGKIGVEIAFTKLLEMTNTHPTYQPIPKSMPIIEDLTFTLPKEIAVGEVITTLKNTDKLITAVELKDIYKKNYTFTINFHDLKRNLSASDIEPIRKSIVKQIEKQHQAKLVGEV
ncbi:MAG: phenylalanine--tRNA ligase subunit beta [Candidatus Pacebacteria bacterium]|jgi:phenylalanyl-tRNA synthetase beta chain|nr:phenylalanine--tRNA ligase subunit beta [Candidatus Paceibacterota bacterium]MBT3511912.1 phenylalanine--tRNA ligase subunit beta [Candidatus Paceibacterota bacterium]MBT4005234.1 phenylalanine--tRNA ligase subunit beta [Candidatus Paceibacterota bacterium]MBT4358954.1 phenylalanine--tRNA ligase subunit beta [Candidatus Paceibacterota bacterium]MBT4680481.1 phenylalanine--tRNA ligase subunit beta [Candidatus Paceibacterota bacterium]